MDKRMRRIELKQRVTLQDAEATVTRLGAAPEDLGALVVDLSDAVDIEIGAGVRIGNALRRYASFGLEVFVPPYKNEGWDKYFSRHWSLLTRSGLGLAIATHATRIVASNNQVSDAFRKYYLDEYGETSQNLVIKKNIHEVVSINADDRDAFAMTFYSYLPKVNVHPGAFNRGDLATLIDLCREGVLNVRDHAFRKPLPSNTKILSYCSLRYYQDISGISAGMGPLAPYLDRLHKQHDEKRGGISGYLELIVNDDGVGVAGRQSQSQEIYWGPKGREEEVLLDALRKGASIKPVVMDAIVRGDPGYGFSIMADSLRRLNGFASLRTGRYLSVCDGTRRDPFSTAFSIAKGRSSMHLGYLPGTLIQALVPIRSPQGALELR